MPPTAATCRFRPRRASRTRTTHHPEATRHGRPAPQECAGMNAPRPRKHTPRRTAACLPPADNCRTRPRQAPRTGTHHRRPPPQPRSAGSRPPRRTDAPRPRATPRDTDRPPSLSLPDHTADHPPRHAGSAHGRRPDDVPPSGRRTPLGGPRATPDGPVTCGQGRVGVRGWPGGRRAGRPGGATRGNADVRTGVARRPCVAGGQSRVRSAGGGNECAGESFTGVRQNSRTQGAEDVP